MKTILILLLLVSITLATPLSFTKAFAQTAIDGFSAAKLIRATVIREPRATFSLAPGQPQRPSAETGVQGFFLAGDWIDTGLPATIESAVRSGHRAADCCIG